MLRREIQRYKGLVSAWNLPSRWEDRINPLDTESHYMLSFESLGQKSTKSAEQSLVQAAVSEGFMQRGPSLASEGQDDKYRLEEFLQVF